MANREEEEEEEEVVPYNRQNNPLNDVLLAFTVELRAMYDSLRKIVCQVQRVRTI
jgi:hypothetical protein